MSSWAWLTLGIVLVGKVTAVGWARRVDAPEGAAVLAGAEPREVHVAGKTTVHKGLGEVLVIDAILVEPSHKDREVIVTICIRCQW